MQSLWQHRRYVSKEDIFIMLVSDQDNAPVGSGGIGTQDPNLKPIPNVFPERIPGGRRRPCWHIGVHRVELPNAIFAVRAGLRDKKKVWIQTACHAEMPTGEIVGKGACRKRYWRWLRLAQ